MKAVMTFFVLLTVLAACSSHRNKVVKNGDTQPPLSELFKEKIIPESVEQHIADWPSESREAARAMINEHGVPQGVTDSMLVWNNLSPYRQTMVYKEPLLHEAHRDVKEYLTSDNSRICEHEALKMVSR